MPKIMEKIKKDYKIKIMAIFIILVCSINTKIYAVELYNKNHLRVPMKYGITQDRADDLEEPELIYIQLKEIYFPLIATMPSASMYIPENFITHLGNSTNKISLVYKNNGYLKVKKTLPINAINRILQKLNIPEKYKNEMFYFLYSALKNNPHLLDKVLDINDYLEEEEKYDFDKQPELKSIIYRGKEYSLDEFKKAIPNLFKDTIELMKGLSQVQEGSYLYRTITRGEWNSIKERGIFVVLQETNFEGNIGPQVKLYHQDKEYAGIIIRIPVVGPYFRRSGLQVPRITSVMPHFVKPEILLSEPGAPEKIWVSIEEYLRYRSGFVLESAKDTGTQI